MENSADCAEISENFGFLRKSADFQLREAIG